MLGILPLACAVVEGEIWLGGTNLLALKPAAPIPQDPMSALNPSRRIGVQITDRLVDILGGARPAADARAPELLARVQIPEPAKMLRLIGMSFRAACANASSSHQPLPPSRS